MRFISHTFPASLLIVMGSFPTASPISAQQVAPPIRCGFEEPDYRTGSIDGQHGWSVQQGNAEIVTGEAHGGQNSLKLFASDPFSQAKLTLAPAVPPASVMFLDFHVIPAASRGGLQEEFLDIDGARIGLFVDAANPGEGVVHVFHGDGAGGGQWQQTGVKLPLKEGSGQTAAWVRLTLREDFGRQVWDVWVDGKAAAANLGFQDADVGHTQNYIIMGDAMESVLLDDLTIGATNPQGPDGDFDGIVDSIERQLGLNQLFDDRDGDADGDGAGNLEEALAAANEGEGAGIVNPAPPRPSPPAVSAASGFVEAPVVVALSGAPSGGKIRYTLDGSDPRRVSGSESYAGPLTVGATSVLRAVAVDTFGRMSDPVTAAWVFAGQVASQGRPANAAEVVQDVPRAGGPAMTFTIPWRLATGEGTGEIQAASVPGALRGAPVVVLAAGPQKLFAAGGVYAQSSQKITVPAGVVYLVRGLPR